MRTDTGKTFHLEDYRPAPYGIETVELTFRLDPEKTQVKSRLAIVRREGTDKAEPLVLDGDDLKLVSVSVNGRTDKTALAAATDELLTLTNLPEAERFTVEIETEINPTANKALSGLYRSDGIFCTQCEAEGFRRITYFLDRPDILSVYSVRIEGPKKECPLLLANGNPLTSGALAEGWHFAEWNDPHPKPSYLFALVAGDLGVIADRFKTISGREVELRIYVEHGREARATYAMDALKRSMSWDEEKFGREYDLDLFMIVAVSSFNMGAMENKGLNIFNDKYVLADPETATDTDYAGIEAVIAHEYFHNWTGNRITCRDWFQLCLKEGLTVFRDHEFSADMRSRAVTRISEVRGLKANQFPEDQGPLSHPVRPRKYREINNFYTATVYQKGSEVVRMLKTIIGAKKFGEGMDLYFERHDGQAVTIEDFIACFEAVTHKDLSQFSLWYHQAGTPTLMVTSQWDRASKTFTLEFDQAQKPTPGERPKKPLHIPVSFALIGANGSVMKPSGVDGAKVEDGVIHIKKKRQKVVFEGIGSRPVPSLLRGFSAPVSLSFDQRSEDRLFLAKHDGDLYSRWQALTAQGIEALKAATNVVRGGKKPHFAKALLEAYGSIATDEKLEAAFRALCLAVPSEGDVAREIGQNVDPDAIHGAREALIGAIAETNGPALERLYASLPSGGSFSPDAAAAGNRALRNTLLDYLGTVDGKPDRAAKSFAVADNMTDRLAAFSILVNRFGGSGETNEAIAAFEKRHGKDALVMDKWFMVQAMAPGPDTLDVVNRLTGHRLFSFENPNRMRALIGTFASANPTGFNRKDGAGYRFLADFTLRVDKANPQTAARILTAMRSWRSLEDGRREKAREALARIASAPDLSADVRDIAERTLA